jgi:transposase-like protein
MITMERLLKLVKNKAPLGEIAKESFTNLLEQVLEIEADLYIAEHQETLEDGRARFARRGRLPARAVPSQFGRITVSPPRVEDRRTGGGQLKFESGYIPKPRRMSAELLEMIPLAYMKGIPLTDIGPYLQAASGQEIKGLSSQSINRVVHSWEGEFAEWSGRDLSGGRYAYMWAEGLSFNLSRDLKTHCQLALLGADASGRKRLVAMSGGDPESSESWLGLLSGAKERGLEAPRLVTGDERLGLWAALSRLYPGSARQACWFHKGLEVMRRLPESERSQAREALKDICQSESKAEALKRIKVFGRTYREYPKAAESVAKRADWLLAFYDFPFEHWTQIRTSNPLGAFFSSIWRIENQGRCRLGAKRQESLVYKLSQTATERMDPVTGAGMIAEVLKGRKFTDGKPV